MLLTVVNNGRNGSNRCAINETGYASGNSQKSSMQVRNSRTSSTQVAMVETTTYKSVVIEAIARNDWSITSCSLGTTPPAMLHRQTTKSYITEPWRLPNCGTYRIAVSTELRRLPSCWTIKPLCQITLPICNETISPTCAKAELPGCKMTLYLVLHIGVSNLVANPKLHPNASYTRLPNIPAALRAW